MTHQRLHASGSALPRSKSEAGKVRCSAGQAWLCVGLAHRTVTVRLTATSSSPSSPLATVLSAPKHSSRDLMRVGGVRLWDCRAGGDAVT